jgi:hypothetical protein
MKWAVISFQPPAHRTKAATKLALILAVVLLIIVA